MFHAMLLLVQEAERKGSGQQAALAPSAPPPVRSYAELVRSKGDGGQSGSTQQSGRPQTPSQPSAAAVSTAPAQPASPAAAPALPNRAAGNHNQSRSGSTAVLPPTASSDASSKGENQRGAANVVSMDRPMQSNSHGPPARPPYNAPGRPGQNFRDDESGRKAVYVRNIPQVGRAAL